MEASFQNAEKLEDERLQHTKKAGNLFPGRLRKQKVTRDFDLLNDFRKAFSLTSLSSYADTAYTETELPQTSEDYIEASDAFKTKNKRFFTVSKITKVDNTFQVLQYMLMKDKYLNCFNEVPLTERLMFHGTKREFLENICTYNFDRSKVIKHKFGYGISFAKNPYFATHYHRKNQGNYHKVMVITKMFWGGLDLGSEDMIIPSEPHYASVDTNNKTIVKYDYASFYPVYIVYYDGLDRKYKNRRKVLYD